MHTAKSCPQSCCSLSPPSSIAPLVNAGCSVPLTEALLVVGLVVRAELAELAQLRRSCCDGGFGRGLKIGGIGREGNRQRYGGVSIISVRAAAAA
jgi:hypothetical protein